MSVYGVFWKGRIAPELQFQRLRTRWRQEIQEKKMLKMRKRSHQLIENKEKWPENEAKTNPIEPKTNPNEAILWN